MRTRSSKEFNEAAAEEQSKQEATAVVEKEVEEPVVHENVSDEPVVTLEDVERAKTLFNEGKRHYVCGNMADATDALSQVCKTFGSFYGETAVECVEPYYYYGRALLELARKEPDVVAGAVEGTCLADLDKEGQEGEQPADEAEKTGNGSFQVVEDTSEGGEIPTEEQVREQVLEALEENAAELELAASKNTKGDGTTAAEKATDAGEAAQKETAQEETPVEEGGQDDEANDEGVDAEDNKENGETVAEEEMPEEVSNLQLSWEMLDLARSILEKHDDKSSRERLADVRLALGEQAMEDEQFEKAVNEFDAALEIQKQVLPQDDRRISLSYYNIAVAYNAVEKYEEAAESFKRAVFILEMRRANLKMKSEAHSDAAAAGEDKSKETEKTDIDNEISELNALITDIKSRIQDCIESRAQTDAAKPALDELTKGPAEKTEMETTVGDQPASDVSHLVRKSVKRVSGGGAEQSEEPNKKAKIDETGVQNGTNGADHANGDKTETVNSN